MVELVLGQTRLTGEIIVVDDASTDDNVEILRQLPVHLVCHEKNQWPAITCNTSLQAAVWDIVVYIDLDAYTDRCILDA